MLRIANLKIAIVIIIAVAAILRVLYARDIPLSGDESVSMLQASGHAVGYENRLSDGVFSSEQIKRFVSYSEDRSIKDTFASLRYGGMHPPFYYVLLHYVLKFFGNSAYFLRLISVFVSLLSVLCMYQLGKRIYNENVGLCSALLLAVSSYGVMYASIVRPYPLAMLLSLVSTYQVYELAKKGNFSLNIKNIFLYAIIVLMGLYTIYHFLFVFAFQIVFLVIHNFWDRKVLLKIGVLSAGVLLLYLPWAPSLFDQLTVIRNGSFYYHKESSLLSFVKYITFVNFIGYTPGGSFGFVAILISTIVYFLILIGCYFSFKDRNKRIFIIGLMIYFLSYFAGEKIMGINTLNVGKFLFFIIPISLLLLVAGIFRITNRYHIRIMLIFLCCGLLLCNTVALCYKVHPSSYGAFDGPIGTLIFPNTINKNLKQDQKGLIIINTAQRRDLLSLAHAIKDPVDIKIIHSNNVESELPDISNLRDYDYVVSANCYVPYEVQSFLSVQDIRFILNYLAKNGYRLVEPTKLFYAPGLSSLMVFEKKL